MIFTVWWSDLNWESCADQLAGHESTHSQPGETPIAPQTFLRQQQSVYCHTRTQLTITAHLILISDDQLGPHSGIKIIWKPSVRPADQPTSRPAGAIVVGTQMSLNLTELDLFMQTKSLGLCWVIIMFYSDLNPIKRGSILNPILYHYIAFIRTSSNLF